MTTARHKFGKATFFDAGEFIKWFERAKAGEQIIYYAGQGLAADCEDNGAPGKLIKLRQAVQEAAFEDCPQDKFVDRKTLHLVQRRVGPRAFEYVAIKRGGGHD